MVRRLCLSRVGFGSRGYHGLNRKCFAGRPTRTETTANGEANGVQSSLVDTWIRLRPASNKKLHQQYSSVGSRCWRQLPGHSDCTATLRSSIFGLKRCSTSWPTGDNSRGSIFGLWPQSEEAQAIAQEALREWDDIVANSLVKNVHRVTYRIMHPDGFGDLATQIRETASTGAAPMSLLRESFELNMTLTCEQSTEGIHAVIHMANLSPGRMMDPPQCCARINLPRNISLVQDWRAFLFISTLFHYRKLTRGLLEFSDVPDVFRRFAPLRETWLAIYHATPMQLFCDLANDNSLMGRWSDNTVCRVEPLPTVEQNKKKLFSDYLKARLASGTLFFRYRPRFLSSLPAPAAAAVAQGDLDAVRDVMSTAIVRADCAVELNEGHRHHTFPGPQDLDRQEAQSVLRPLAESRDRCEGAGVAWAFSARAGLFFQRREGLCIRKHTFVAK